MALKTYWHVTAAPWDGGDLLSWQLAEESGLVTLDDFHWDRDLLLAGMYEDAQTVALTETRADLDVVVDAIRENGYGVTGSVLRIDLDDEECDIGTNGEGYPCVHGSIPAHLITYVGPVGQPGGDGDVRRAQ